MVEKGKIEIMCQFGVGIKWWKTEFVNWDFMLNPSGFRAILIGTSISFVQSNIVLLLDRFCAHEHFLYSLYNRRRLCLSLLPSNRLLTHQCFGVGWIRKWLHVTSPRRWFFNSKCIERNIYLKSFLSKHQQCNNVK